MTIFADLGLPASLLSVLDARGFLTPTPIQQQAIPPLLADQDVIGIAQTGTGKTAAFALPLLAKIRPEDRHVCGLVLCPTRELAMQVADATADLASEMPHVRVVAVYGGSPYPPQIQALKAGAQIVVGTPGRVMDLIEKGHLQLDNIHTLVLDEADEMLRMGFAEDVDTIAASCPGERTTALFSATMPPAIARVAKTHMHDAQRVEVSRQASTVKTVTQEYAIVAYRQKNDALYRVLATATAEAAIVFVRTRATAEEVTADLTSRKISASALSSDVPQAERERLVARLRSGSLNVIVATDVAARGLDVERIGLVVNYDVPREAESYVHRIGRTGRAGRSGRAVTFFTPKEHRLLKMIEKLTGTALTEIKIPTIRAVHQHSANQLLATVPNRLSRGELADYKTAVAALGEDPTEIAAALLALAVGDDGSRREEDANAHWSGAVRRSGESAERRYRIEVGARDNVTPAGIVGAITGEGGLRGTDLGKIDIFPSFSLVTMHVELDDQTLRDIARAQLRGRALRIRKDTGPKGGGRPGKGGKFRGKKPPRRKTWR